MALIELTNEENPKLRVKTNGALNYIDKTEGIKQRKPETALNEVIVEAGKVVGMDKGAVTLSVSTQGNYETYFVNKDDKNNIILRPADNPNDKERTVYVNSINKQDGGYFYAINTKSPAGQNLVENLDVRTVEREGHDSAYIKATVMLKNDELKAELSQKGNGHTAILSKEGFRIVSNDELKKQTPQKEKEVASPEVKKEESPKKKFQPKAKTKSVKEVELER